MQEAAIAANVNFEKLFSVQTGLLEGREATMVETATPELSGKLEVTIPEETFTAGSPSVVRVVVHNPFPIDIEILEIVAPQSSLVRRVIRNSGKYFQKQPEADGSASVDDDPAYAKTKVGYFAERFISGLLLSSVSVAGLGVSASFSDKPRRLALRAEAGSDTRIERDLSDFDEVSISASENAKLVIASPTTEDASDEPETHRVRPHCDKVAYFSIMSNGWLFFTPQRINLSTEIRYRIGGEERTQVVNSYFDIKPPLASMIAGSLFGGSLGSIARILQNGSAFEVQSAIVSVGASVIMSLIAAIALSRKSGTQGFITVEDFFGAFVIGSLIGYGGSEYFDRAILPQDG